MRLEAVPLFAALKDAMAFHSERSRVVADNVAHSDIAGFVPKDIAGGDVGKAIAARKGGRMVLTTTVTQPGHISPARSGGATTFTAAAAPDSETTLDGNAVVLEEQMAKLAEARMGYDTAIGLYQKAIGLVRISLKSPGR